MQSGLRRNRAFLGILNTNRTVRDPCAPPVLMRVALPAPVPARDGPSCECWLEGEAPRKPRSRVISCPNPDCCRRVGCATCMPRVTGGTVPVPRTSSWRRGSLLGTVQLAPGAGRANSRIAVAPRRRPAVCASNGDGRPRRGSAPHRFPANRRTFARGVPPDHLAEAIVLGIFGSGPAEQGFGSRNACLGSTPV